MISKNNVPYYIAGTLTALTLLASGVFAIAPYIGFLAPVAALSVGLPFIIGCAVFSVVTIALSYKAISKNKTISEKEAQLADEKSKVEAKDKIISEKEKEISEKNNQLANQAKEIEDKDKTISEKEAQLAEKSTDIFNPRNQLDEEKAKEEEISKKESEGGEIVEDSSVSRLARAAVGGGGATVGIAGVAVLGGIAGGMVGYILGLVIPGLYVDKSIIFTTKKQNEVYESAKGALGSGVKNAYDISIESVKEKLSNASDAVGSGVKSVCNAMPSTESVRNRVPSLKTVGWIAGGTGLLVGATYIAANGGLGVAGNSSNAVGNSTNSTESGVSIPNSSSVCYRPTYQQIMQIQIDEASKKLADAEKFAENNFGMSEEDEPQWSKNLTNHTYSNNTASKAEANPITNLSDTTLSFPPVTSLVVVGS